MVFYPRDLAHGTHPLIMIEHGLRATCAGPTQAWPCPAGEEQIPSYRGYDYLAEQLAGLGFVVVSIGANGINATSFGQAPTVYYARRGADQRATGDAATTFGDRRWPAQGPVPGGLQGSRGSRPTSAPSATPWAVAV